MKRIFWIFSILFVVLASSFKAAVPYSTKLVSAEYGIDVIDPLFQVYASSAVVKRDFETILKYEAGIVKTIYNNQDSLDNDPVNIKRLDYARKLFDNTSQYSQSIINYVLGAPYARDYNDLCDYNTTLDDMRALFEVFFDDIANIPNGRYPVDFKIKE